MIEELLPFGVQTVNDFFCPKPEICKQQKEFRETYILSIFDHRGMMHVKFHEDAIRCREIIAL